MKLTQEPKKPVKPAAPVQPREYTLRDITYRTSISDCDNFEAIKQSLERQSDCKDIPLNKIIFKVERGYYDSIESEAIVTLQAPPLLNRQYKRQLEAYTRKLAAYNVKLADYNKEKIQYPVLMRQWKEQLRRDRIEKAKAVLREEGELYDNA